MKLCKACGQEKPTSEFHKDKSKSDGLNAYCKTCQIERQREYLLRPRRHKSPEGLKRCQHCKQEKPVDQFGNDSGTYDGLRRSCKRCAYKKQNTWRLKNLEKAARDQKRWRKENPEHVADYHLQKNYGLSPGTYQQMLNTQHGRCAICGTDKPNGRGKRFHVDHCHDTLQVRGLLCNTCNTGLGSFKHAIEILQQAIAYLHGKP